MPVCGIHRLTGNGLSWYFGSMNSTGMHTGSPVYRTLALKLKASIAKGHYAPGERVASEHELSRQHGLARVTVRKATELLVAEGLLERRPGKGLYVREKSRTAGMLKIMVGNLAWEPSIRIVRGAQQVARERGYEVQVCDAHGDVTEDMESVGRLTENGARGAVIVALHTAGFRAAVARLRAEGFAFVMVDAHCGEEAGMTSVAADNYRGGFLTGTRMGELGHERVGFIGDTASSTVADRLAGFRDGLAEFGVALPRSLVRDIVVEDPFADWGEAVREACEGLLTGRGRPTAVFCSCDAVARMCYRFCGERGLLIPEDVGVVGFDDDPMAEWLTPGLTTVRQPFAEIGATAVRLLEAQLTGAEGAAQGHHALPVELIERGSLAKARKTI